MELTLGVTLAVLGAALLHAAWNAMIKSGQDVLLDTALVALGGSAVAAPLLLAVSPPEAAAWPWLFTSAVVHIGYYTTLVGAYRAGDLSQSYPIMRGSAPLVVAVVSLAWFGEAPSAATWAGILLICGGVLSLGFGAGGHASRSATLWALANAAIIATYTVADATGVRAAGGAVRYVAWLFFFMGLPFGSIVLARRGRAFLAHASKYWWRGISGAAFSGAAYGIALWAMTRAPVAAVAALRETSVIFAALLGAWMLREGHVRRRLGGAAAVLAGVIALKL